MYSCTYDSKLVDLEDARGGRGECHCSQCGYEDPKMPKYEGVCIEEVELCYGTDDYSIYNETMQKQCKEQGCYTCKDICHQKKECFDMNRDYTVITELQLAVVKVPI